MSGRILLRVHCKAVALGIQVRWELHRAARNNLHRGCDEWKENESATIWRSTRSDRLVWCSRRPLTLVANRTVRFDVL